MATNRMNKLLSIVALLAIFTPAFAQTQGVSMRSTNGIGYGNTVINSLTINGSYFRVTNTARANSYTDVGANGAITNVNPNGGGFIMLTNAAAAGTYTYMQSPSNGANVKVFGTVTNSVEKFSITSAGAAVQATVTATSPGGSSSIFSVVELFNGYSYYGWLGSVGGRIGGPAAGMISLLDQNQIGGAHILLGGGSTPVALASTTNWPAIKPVTNDYPEVRFVLGTNVTAFSSIKADQVTSTNRVTGNIAWMTNGTINATTFFSLPTNYVAANFIPVAGRVNIVSSNGALFSVTQLSTNLISGP